MRSNEPPEFHCGRTGRRWPATPAPDESSLTAFTKSMPNRCITGSRVKGVTGSRTRSTGRSPSTRQVRITAQRTLDAAGTTRASRQRGMSRAKPAHIPPRRVGQDPTREAETEGVSVAGTAKAAGRPTGREDRSPQGSRLGTRLDAKHESPVDAQQKPPEFHCGRTGRRWPATPAPDESSLTAFTKSMPNRCITRKPGQGRDRKPHAEHRAQPEHQAGEITAQRTLDAAGTTRASRQRGMSRAKPAHIPPRRVGQDPTREAETEGFRSPERRKRQADRREEEDRSPQGRDSARGSMQHEPGRCAAASRPNFTAAELDDAGQPHRHRTKAA